MLNKKGQKQNKKQSHKKRSFKSASVSSEKSPPFSSDHANMLHEYQNETITISIQFTKQKRTKKNVHLKIQNSNVVKLISGL